MLLSKIAERCVVAVHKSKQELAGAGRGHVPGIKARFKVMRVDSRDVSPCSCCILMF